MREVANRSITIAFTLTVAIAGWLVWHHRTGAAAGLAVSVAWSIVNFLCIVKILEIAIMKDAGKDLTRVLLIKFPLLYACGFWLVTSKLFPTASLLGGIPVALLSIGGATVWPKRT